MINKFYVYVAAVALAINTNGVTCYGQQKSKMKREPFRPELHYTPKNFWMNDPNGMVYHQGVYHLFYQYSPGSTTFGPIHWGHAITKDLITWQEQQIALSPDSLGYIFSGSAVADPDNTSGLAKNGETPLIAFYTSHDPVAEKKGAINYETQSLAYSLDNGKNWRKYAKNPIIANSGVKDFRDPKVSWYSDDNKWVMALAVSDHIDFYSSKNLLDWIKEGEFGKNESAHGGVWECPDLFPMTIDGKKVWILLVSMNLGGPAGGSATQYFTGSFDGKTFTSNSKNKWIDYGSDSYAGVTWSNSGVRKIFLAWMSNWNYGIHVPTKSWRGAMTIPRELGLKYIGNDYFLTNLPVRELDKNLKKQQIPLIPNVEYQKLGLPKSGSSYKLDFIADCNADFSICFQNAFGEYVIAGYDKILNQFYVDRTHGGKTDFYKGFATKHSAQRIAKNGTTRMSILIDQASIELFADDGLTSITDVYFPKSILNKVIIQNKLSFPFKEMEFGVFKGGR